MWYRLGRGENLCFIIGRNKNFPIVPGLAFALRICYAYYSKFCCDIHDKSNSKGQFLYSSKKFSFLNYIKLTSEQDIKNMTRLIELLEEDDDVQNVWHNWEQDED